MVKTFKTFILVLPLAILSIAAKAQNQSINQNQQTININVPVIEKEVYIDRYRTVYVDRPSPRRESRKLDAPVQLHGYLWVYPEDVGEFKCQYDACEIIKNINNNNRYGHNTWRIPTAGELALLEQNGDEIGLGDQIYMATNHANGVLRLVSTGPSVEEQRLEQERQDRIEHQRAIDRQSKINRAEREARWARDELIRTKDESIRQKILRKEQ